MRSAVCQHGLFFILSVVCRDSFLTDLPVIGQHRLFSVLTVVCRYRLLYALSVVGQNVFLVIEHSSSLIGKNLFFARYGFKIFQHIGFLIFRRISVGQLELLCKRIFLALRIRLGRLGLYAFRYSQ